MTTQSTMLASASNASFSTTGTWYAPFGSVGAATIFDTTPNPTMPKFRHSTGGILKNLTVRIGSNTKSNGGSAAGSIAVGQGIGGGIPATTALSVTLPAGGGGSIIQDTTHTLTLSDGDTLNYSLTVAGTGAIGIACVAVELQTADQVNKPLVAYGHGSYSGAKSCIPGGQITSQPTDASGGAKCLESSALLSNLQTYISTNAGTGMDILVHVNGAAPTNGPKIAAATIGSGTGWFEDTTHTASLNLGDTFSYATGATSGAVGVGYIGATYTGQAANSTGRSMLSGNAVGTNIASGAHVYGPYLCPMSSTESQAQLVNPFSTSNLMVSMMSVYVSTNAEVSSSLVITSRFSSAGVSNYGGMSLSIAPGNAGVFKQDTTGHDIVSPGQTFGMSMTGNDGIVTLNWMGCLVDGPGSGSLNPPSDNSLMLRGCGS